MIFSCFRNSSYEWAYVYKKVAGFPTVFWDASSTDRFVSVTAAPQAGRVKKCARVNATDYTRRCVPVRPSAQTDGDGDAPPARPPRPLRGVQRSSMLTPCLLCRPRQADFARSPPRSPPNPTQPNPPADTTRSPSCSSRL